MPRWMPGRRDPATPAARPPDETGVTLHLVQGATYPTWEAIYLDNVHRIYRLMFSKVGNRPDAEDLTAEVFLAVLRPLRISATVGEVRAYLLATARTVLAAHWRRTLGREVTTIDVEQVAAEFDRPPETGGLPQRVDRILTALPDRYRSVLELRFLRSYSIRETAAELGTSVGNVKVLQHRALRLAAEIVRDDPTDTGSGR
jgi:RNA polymerase sigma factor (sigma-70 family)